jgi:HSP20 family protein
MPTLAPEKANGTSLQPAYVDPFASFTTMRRAMVHSLLEPIVARTFEIDIVPAVNLYEKGGFYTLECALPGYKKNDITVEANGDTVTISGSFSQEKTDEKQYHRRELRRGSFIRTVGLPQEIDSDKVTAIFENGILTVTLSPTKAVKAKSIPISG